MSGEQARLLTGTPVDLRIDGQVRLMPWEEDKLISAGVIAAAAEQLGFDVTITEILPGEEEQANEVARRVPLSDVLDMIEENPSETVPTLARALYGNSAPKTVSKLRTRLYQLRDLGHIKQRWGADGQDRWMHKDVHSALKQEKPDV